MNHWLAVAVAVVFVWLGVGLAISFLEAPLKFRAPGVTVPIGLGIGRLVFRALNSFEVAFAITSLTAVVLDGTAPGAGIGVLIAVTALGIQLVAVRPMLTKYSDGVLAGTTVVRDKRSRAHHAYVVLEVVKVLALLAGGIQLLI